jgi:serine/threonine protein kinase
VYRKSFNVRYCLESIANGIEHLHSIGIVHNDIKPGNIFVKFMDQGFIGPQQWVIGDFDSAQDTGALLMLKGGTKLWNRPKIIGRHYAEEGDDWYGFQKVKKWLVMDMGGTLSMFDDVGKKV